MMYYSVYDIGKRISEEAFYRQRLSVAGWVHNEEFVNKVIVGDYYGIFPLHIELCSTYKCNFNCSWCSCRKSRFSSGNEQQSLDISELRSIIDQCAEKSIGIQWTGGEPLVNEATIDAIEYGAKHEINQCLFTNGSRLNADYCERLLQTNLRFIRISLNCVSEEYHSKFHGNISLNLSRQTIDNISVLCRTKQLLASGVKIGISIVTDSNNIDDLQNTMIYIRERAIEYPNTIDYIVVRSVNEDFDGIEFEKKKNFNERYTAIVNKIDYDDLFRLGIDVVFPNELSDINPRESKCLGCSVFSEVAPDGTLFLCSDKYGNKNYKIGNLLESTFDTVWDSEELKGARIRHANCFANGFCPSFSRGWYFNYIFSQIEEYRLDGKLDVVKKWIGELKESVPVTCHSFFI